MNAPFVLQSSPKSQAWSAPEALLGILTTIAVWDGQRAARRLALVHAFAKQSTFLHPLGEAGLIALQTKVVERIGAAHGDALAQACAALPPEMGPSVYAQCLDVVASIGPLSECDRAIMAELRSLLSVDPPLAEKVETVILLKNRY